MNIRFLYEGPAPVLVGRELLGHSVSEYHASVLKRIQTDHAATKIDWMVYLPSHILFDKAGLELIGQSIKRYQGSASCLWLELEMSPHAMRDFYSLQPQQSWNEQRLKLAIKALRSIPANNSEEIFTLRLPDSPYVMPLPQSMGGPMSLAIPHALLIPYQGDFDLLFANQIAILSGIRQRVRVSPMTWMRGLVQYSSGDTLTERTALAYRKIHPKARVHPTAVVEGSAIEEGADIGAHCTVRYSVIGAGARLCDGAKAEFSVVGARSWLMHDLVIYRSCLEEDVFLIHGPYQFSYFQKRSSAFATIMMDFRPDQKTIKVKTPNGLKSYEGRFLGSVLGEGAKALGGCLLAPGRIVPPHTWLGPNSSSIHMLDEESIPTQVAVPPNALKRRTDEQRIN